MIDAELTTDSRREVTEMAYAVTRSRLGLRDGKGLASLLTTATR